MVTAYIYLKDIFYSLQYNIYHPRDREGNLESDA